MTLIQVPERGERRVNAATWRALENEPSFGRLVEAGILGAALRTGGEVVLQGSCYVGRALCGEGVVLEVREKIPGALLSLIRAATADAFRVERIEAPASEIGDLFRLLLEQFTLAVQHYASAGRDARYVNVRHVSSLAGGRLDIRRCIALRARGLRHLLAFERPLLSTATPVNRVILAALREVERLASVITPDDKTLRRARFAAMLFDDCRDVEVLFGSRARWAAQARALAHEQRRAGWRDLLWLAALILEHQSFEPEARDLSGVPRAWFLNLETLFEQAVRREVARQLSGEYRVTKGAKLGRRVLPEAGMLLVDPDIVIRRGTAVPAVGDVKYKTWEQSAAASDLYQLLVHRETLSAGGDAFLVYPHDSFDTRSLGPDALGGKLTLFAVDVRDMKGSVAAMLQTLDLGSWAQPATAA